MSYPNPIQTGPQLQEQWQSSRPSSTPTLPSSWSATLLLSPFGDSIAPLTNYSQLVVGQVDYSCSTGTRAMRVRLYNTVDLTYFDFAFVTSGTSPDEQTLWYWHVSTPGGPITATYGPYVTTLSVPPPDFLSANGVQWGNAYPLMTIPVNHWVVPTPSMTSSPDHGSWYSFRQADNSLFRIFMMDSNNPLLIPVLGSYYVANFPSFSPGAVSPDSEQLFASLAERAKNRNANRPTGPSYWNPMITQEDIQRAMAFPLASAPCTPAQIQAIIPGFVPMPQGVPLPTWSDQTYVEAWTLGTDLIPYWTQVCYLWTGDAQSKQQSLFLGLGQVAGQSTYFERSDACLNTYGFTQPYWVWTNPDPTAVWMCTQCMPAFPGVGLPYPDWVARDGGVVMAQITGNANFGLGPGQQLNLIAAQLPRGAGELAIFWVWFTGDGNGVLFTEGNYMNPLSHNLQLIDYTLFVQNAGIVEGDFENTQCGWTPPGRGERAREKAAHGHLTRVGKR